LQFFIERFRGDGSDASRRAFERNLIPRLTARDFGDQVECEFVLTGSRSD
jgi:hypothetical protein